MNSLKTKNIASSKPYVIGFVLSVLLTITAYVLTVRNIFGASTFFWVIFLLALMQFAVQAIYFLHIGRGTNRKNNIITLSFMLLVVVILVLGTLWIMQNLDYHHDMKSPQELEQEIIKDEGYHSH